VCACAGDAGVRDSVKTRATMSGEELWDLGLGTTMGNKSGFWRIELHVNRVNNVIFFHIFIYLTLNSVFE
jgi:hypothetical protein